MNYGEFDPLQVVLIWVKLQYLCIKMSHLQDGNKVPPSANFYEAKMRPHL